MLLALATPALAHDCLPDFDGSGNVGFGDLTTLLLDWGTCRSRFCPADLDESGDVGFDDLTGLLLAWGPCPGPPCDRQFRGDESAIPFGIVGNTFNGDLCDNAAEAGDMDTCGHNNTIDEWLAWVPECDGTLTVTTCHSETQFDSVLSVWLDGFEMACNDDLPEGCVPATYFGTSSVSLFVAQGFLYVFRVSANDDLAGQAGFGTRYVLTVTLDPPGLSDCCTAGNP